MEEPKTEDLKFVVVGDGAVGKSCLLITCSTNSFPKDYVPTVFDNYSVNTLVNGTNYAISLWDTAGQEEYSRLRALSYPKTDVFLICYSTANRISLMNVRDKWVPEITHHMPDTPFVIVGLKKDLRDYADEPSTNHVTTQEGEAMAKEVRAAAFVECSSLTRDGLTKVFDTSFNVCFGKNAPTKTAKSGFLKGLFGGRSKSSNMTGGMEVNKDPEPVAPVMPKGIPAPWIYPTESKIAEDWGRMLDDPEVADCHISLESDNSVIYAHSILLRCASARFSSLFEDGAVAAPFTAVRRNEDTNIWTVTVQASLTKTIMKRVLTFLYTGNCVINNKDDQIAETMEAAELFELPFLQSYCQNILANEQEMNPSIGTYLTDQTAEQLRKNYFLNAERSDVRFSVEGTEFPVNKTVVTARCEVLKRMLLNPVFVESTSSKAGKSIEIRGDATAESFKALLLFLYTEHTELENSEALVDVLQIASQYGADRLVSLCELYISKLVERGTADDIVHQTNVDLVGLLTLAGQLGAKQLEQFLLHFFCVNYFAVSQREDFKELSPEHAAHVDKNQWPPKSYFDAVSEFEKKHAAWMKRNANSGSTKSSIFSKIFNKSVETK